MLRSLLVTIPIHGGFSLVGLVSYNERHHFANGEYDRDGDSHNHSWNHGIEGETQSTKIVAAHMHEFTHKMIALRRNLPLLINSTADARKIQFPKTPPAGKRWFVIMRTDKDSSFVNEPILYDGWYEVPAHAVVLIKET